MSQEPDHPEQRGQGEQAAWSILSYLIAGPLLYGLIGWGLDSWLRTTPIFLVCGLLLGMGAAFYLIYIRYVKS